MAYRSNTGVSGISSPKIRFFNASGTGSWGSEIELPSAGSPVRWVMAKWSPISDKIVVVSQSDDGNLDGYACLANCTRLSNWVYSSNIGAIGTGTSTRRRFAIEFETSTSDLVLLYGILSTNTARDFGYKVLPAASSSFTGLTEQYIDDTGHATDIQYAWIQLDRKPTNSEELIASVFDITDTDINALLYGMEIPGAILWKFPRLQRPQAAAELTRSATLQMAAREWLWEPMEPPGMSTPDTGTGLPGLQQQHLTWMLGMHWTLRGSHSRLILHRTTFRRSFRTMEGICTPPTGMVDPGS